MPYDTLIEFPDKVHWDANTTEDADWDEEFGLMASGRTRKVARRLQLDIKNSPYFISWFGMVMIGALIFAGYVYWATIEVFLLTLLPSAEPVPTLCDPGDSIFVPYNGLLQGAKLLSLNDDKGSMLVKFTLDGSEQEVPIVNVMKGSALCQSTWPHCQQQSPISGVEEASSAHLEGPRIDVTIYQPLLASPLDPQYCRLGNCRFTDKFMSQEAVECASVCSHASTCQYWYWGFEGHINMCWLLARPPSTHPEGFVSGTRKCTPGMWAVPGFQASLGRLVADHEENVVRRVAGTSLNKCASMCRHEPECALFEYRTITGFAENCVLMSRPPKSESWFGETKSAIGWVLFHRVPQANMEAGVSLIARDENTGLFVDWRGDDAGPVGSPVTFTTCQENCFHQSCRAGLWAEKPAEETDPDQSAPLGHCYLSETLASIPRPCPATSRCMSFRASTAQDLLVEISDLKHQIHNMRGGSSTSAAPVGG
eukprot:GEMP01013585.1.p1 GENE.GEMP01013585.1~~GEMP01013585.1.p1  ORF type:complete len:543 (+),score=65.53 GEMP01013585.1:185-1630(+)